ncbi:MAG: hypothetical protein V1862_08985 [Methanobacteriota archaeon]
MADFITSNTTKTAVRDLAEPIPDITTFVTLVQSILDTNPWGCTTYQSAGQTLPAIAKTRESYSGRIVYENAEAKTVGQISVKAPTAASFNTDVSTIVGTAALNTAMGGSPSHDSSEDKFSCTLRCHDVNGELYLVALSRDKIRLSYFEADTIRTSLETWADNLPILA